MSAEKMITRTTGLSHAGVGIADDLHPPGGRCAGVERVHAGNFTRVGFLLDHDVEPGNGMRVVQLTPPGSACSIVIGTGMGNATTVHGLHLVVEDLDAARDQLLSRGVDVSEISDLGGGARYAYFGDPDGNAWALQQIAR